VRPGCVLPARVPLGQPPSSTSSSVGRPTSFGGFCGTSRLSDSPEPRIIGVRLAASRRDPQLHLPRTTLGSPGSHAWCFRACTGSLTARGPSASCAGEASGMVFRFFSQRRHPGGGSLSRLYTRLARTPLNASTPASRRAPHVRGRRGLIATPSPYDSCSHYTMPVFPGAREAELFYRPVRPGRYEGLSLLPLSAAPLEPRTSTSYRRNETREPAPSDPLP
jgi:hypothetical protein